MTATARTRRHAFPSLVSWLAFGLFFYLSDELDRHFNLSFGLVPLTVLFAAGVFVVWIGHIAANVTKRRWMRLALCCARRLYRSRYFQASAVRDSRPTGSISR